MSHAHQKGYKTTSNNSKPQVLLKKDNGIVQLHTLISKTDISELLLLVQIKNASTYENYQNSFHGP